MKEIKEISTLNKQFMRNILSIFGLIDRNIDQYDAENVCKVLRIKSFTTTITFILQECRIN